MEKKIKRVFAIVMVIFLLSLYVWSFISALLARPEANRMFWAAVFTTIFLPILFYVFIWVADLVRGKGVDQSVEEEKQRTIKNKKVKGGK